MVKCSSGDPLDHYYYNFIFHACLRISGSISVSASSKTAGGKKSILFSYIFSVFVTLLDCLPPRRGHHLLSRKSGMSVTCTPEPALLCSVAFVPSHPQVSSQLEQNSCQRGPFLPVEPRAPCGPHSPHCRGTDREAPGRLQGGEGLQHQPTWPRGLQVDT